jgi:hypothetical protein
MTSSWYVTPAPKDSSTLLMVITSSRGGASIMTLSPSSPSREAAMIGRTEFLAPLTLTLPVNLLPPRTINLLIYGSLRASFLFSILEKKNIFRYFHALLFHYIKKQDFTNTLTAIIPLIKTSIQAFFCT